MNILRRRVKTNFAALALAGLLLPAVQSALAFDNAQDKRDNLRERMHLRGIKNVIFMIPDGCDETVQTLARWYKGEDLQVDRLQNASLKTHMANSVITGSAAAGTAFATGHKTTGRFLGVGPRTDDLLTGFAPTARPYAPVASVLEAAKLKGMATGLVATSRVTHATPAVFACHIEDRGLDNAIMEHMVYNNVDGVFGGGARHLLSVGDTYTTSFGASWGGKREDGENLMDVLTKRGYQFVDNREDMLALSKGPVWGLFDDSHMQPDLDRQYFAQHQPSLAEMTEKAIDLLSQDEDGFFLMVEGSQVDWAGHNNDPVYMVTDFIAFDDAVKVALDFAAAPVGTIDNTDLAHMAAEAMNTDLEKVTEFLYVDLDQAGVAYRIDTTDPENPVLVIDGARLPVSKDYLVVEKKGKSRSYRLSGLTVQAPQGDDAPGSDKCYLSKSALKILQRF